ncbi:hypothetical protein F444_20428 [Phytophthora nicotianae P1976]|uniref:MULE transposase domain-containing protein n=1 Tax=Phytophthora nicotianae P1976 TaxID=1317066 RepID=A0A080Z4P2_PHYNI|nr:hypothetical protein F444_20428 [Phytophthora nicotianae P1976]
MRQQLQRAALESASEAPSMVWERVRSVLNNLHKGSTLNAISKLQGVNIVKNTCKGMGCDMLHSLDKTEARWLSDSDKRSFVRFNTGFSVKNKERRIVGFGHPDLVLLLRNPANSVFIDGTFKMVPKPFVQCLIVMLLDATVNLYVPAMYVLKDETTTPIWTH